MAAVCNGISAYGAVIPFGATFFNFIGYVSFYLFADMPWEQYVYQLYPNIKCYIL